MIIQNYGLHWRRDVVNWGRRGAGNQGDLVGRLAERVNSPHVDFRQQSGIYILHDGFKPLYIGQAGRADQRLFSRLRGHTRNHLAERWDRFSWFGIYPVANGALDDNFDINNIQTNIDGILDHIEGALISVTEPALNRQGARFGQAQQWKQVDTRVAEAEGDDGD